jgi:hypothetical protein
LSGNVPSKDGTVAIQLQPKTRQDQQLQQQQPLRRAKVRYNGEKPPAATTTTITATYTPNALIRPKRSHDIETDSDDDSRSRGHCSDDSGDSDYVDEGRAANEDDNHDVVGNLTVAGTTTEAAGGGGRRAPKARVDGVWNEETVSK